MPFLLPRVEIIYFFNRILFKAIVWKKVLFFTHNLHPSHPHTQYFFHYSFLWRNCLHTIHSANVCAFCMHENISVALYTHIIIKHMKLLLYFPPLIKWLYSKSLTFVVFGFFTFLSINFLCLPHYLSIGSCNLLFAYER